MVAITPISIIPTLDSQSLLVDPRDKLAYVVRWYATAPKSVSNSTPNAMISLADTTSRYQSDSSQMIKAVTDDLQGVFSRIFPSRVANVSVDVSASDNGDGSYNITLQLAVSQNGTNYTIGADVTVDNTGLLIPKWHPTLA
jgi:hypothetical protein